MDREHKIPVPRLQVAFGELTAQGEVRLVESEAIYLTRCVSASPGKVFTDYRTPHRQPRYGSPRQERLSENGLWPTLGSWWRWVGCLAPAWLQVSEGFSAKALNDADSDLD